jgi:integrase
VADDTAAIPIRRSKRFDDTPIAPPPTTGALAPVVPLLSPLVAPHEVLAIELADLPAELGANAQLLADLQRAGQLANRAMAAGTVAVYRKNLEYWQRYCARADLEAFPPAKAAVLAWIGFMSEAQFKDGKRVEGTGLAARTIEQRLNALNKACEVNDWPRPGDDRDVATVLMGMRRHVGVGPRHRAEALEVEVLVDILRMSRRPRLAQLRDRALVTLLAHPDAVAGALARLTWDGVTLGSGELVVTQPPVGRSSTPTVLRYPATGDEDCPVTAMAALAAHEGRSPMWVFTTVTSDDVDGAEHAGDGGLTRAGVGVLVKRALAAAGVENLDPSTMPEVVELVMAGQGADVRDRALLSTGVTTASRRSNMCALEWRDLHFDPRHGVRVRFRRSKTDQYGIGQDLWIPFGTHDDTCPVGTLATWRDLVATHLGEDPMTATPGAPVFVPLTRGGGLRLDQPLSGAAVSKIVKARVAAAGYDPAGFSGHSMRAGFITSAVERDVPRHEIRAITGHKNDEAFGDYIRPLQAKRGNAVTTFGL